MNQPRKTALTLNALALAAATTLGAALAQTTADLGRPNVLFLADTGRAGAVDLYVDGTKVDAGVLATDRPGALRLSPGDHAITVKTSLGGQVLATTNVNVLANSLYAVSLQNDDDTPGYALALASGDTAVRNMVIGD